MKSKLVLLHLPALDSCNFTPIKSVCRTGFAGFKLKMAVALNANEFQLKKWFFINSSTIHRLFQFTLAKEPLKFMKFKYSNTKLIRNMPTITQRNEHCDEPSSECTRWARFRKQLVSNLQATEREKTFHICSAAFCKQAKHRSSKNALQLLSCTELLHKLHHQPLNLHLNTNHE